MLNTISSGTRVNDLLGRLGLPGGMIGAQLDALAGNPVGALRNLQDAYQEAALGHGTDEAERSFGSALPPFLSIARPADALGVMAPFCGGGYAAGFQRVDLGGGRSDARIFGQFLDPGRRSAANFEQVLRSNPDARAAFEGAIGGRIVGFGGNDGKLVVERFPRGFSQLPAIGVNPFAQNALASALGLQQAVLGNAARFGLGALGPGIKPFGGLLLGGLGNLTQGLLGLPQGSPFGFGGLGGAGAGSWNPNAAPGKINNTNPAKESAHQAQVDAVLTDPSLTVEDKVTLMIMLIMKKMDQDIEAQAEHINEIQQQQGDRGGGGKKGGKKGGKGGIGKKGGGKKGGGGGGKKGGGAGGKDGSPSIDVETMKLKRMIDKRGQMFDMLRQIIDKYNETAKGIIQSIGR